MPNPIADFEGLLRIIDEYEGANVDDDTPAPQWVLDMIDDLRTEINSCIEAHSPEL